MEYNNINKILEHLAQFIQERLPAQEAGRLVEFAGHYFQFVALDDLQERMLEDLYGAVLSHWNMALSYQPGTEKIRVYNPSLEEHGWQSQHTIIEIVVEDMPFLLQSITMEINRHGFTNHLVIHPVYHVLRSEQGELQQFSVSEMPGARAECMMHLEIDRQSSAEVMAALEKDLRRILVDVRAATEDWPACLARMQQAIAELREKAAQNSCDKFNDVIDFLQWLHDDHFVFLGYREYVIVKSKGQTGFKLLPDSGLGVLRDSLAPIPEQEILPIPEDAYQSICDDKPLIITKATSQATVHRPVFMDYIGVKQYADNGELSGEKRFLGLYSSSAYYCALQQIPMINGKLERIIARSGFSPKSHYARALMFVLQSLPRNELFQADEDWLFESAMGVLQLQERQRVRVFARHDVYGHFVSLLIFVPRERYHTESRRKIEAILLQTFHGQNVDFSVQLSESILARIHFIIHISEGCCIEYNVRDIEDRIVEALSEWQDDLATELHNYFGEARGNAYLQAYRDGFSAAYREDFPARTALLDLEKIEQLQRDKDTPQLMLYRPLTAAEKKTLRFKLYCAGKPATLSMTLPMLENMGVRVCDERPYEIKKKDSQTVIGMHDFGLIYDQAAELDLETVKPRFQDAFEQCWKGRIENDGFNQLVLNVGLEWAQVNVFRAFYFYLRQIGIAFSQSYVEDTLAGNPEVVKLLIKLFYIRFDATIEHSDAQLEQVLQQAGQAIDQVSSLDEDRILRSYLNLIQAIVRTNYFCFPEDADGVPFFAFKLDSGKVDEMPSPVPYFEIFVYSPRVEGIHLRGGSVARGGLRWSDRREDFRTEILGLMKAQMTKNAVIVPTGAKGGFVVKRLQEIQDRERIGREVIECYRILIRGLLDLTDNLQGDAIIKPGHVVCYDGDDPYLVVAADKGTATFSDYANELSQQYGFWLGDAFASGGSAGYDHKAMGITARGAWESVRHHFEGLGIDVQNTPFTVVGIGGMAGDVFGNGMLLSEQIRLVAAFDHDAIFLDPSPDPAASHQERKRLFALPKCSWRDYDSNLISRGGGVFFRQAKSVALSDEVRKLLNVDQESLTPNALIRAILCAPVDLLWNGGIGTYVKASDESHAEVGDRSNDALRVDARRLRCKVVGEGGNLGFTQRGRIEYARLGGRINTDAIDNSAGVDCSDHEVNIKILLNALVQQGDLTAKQRNALLLEMTDQVAELVLQNNYQQNRAITMIVAESYAELAMIGALLARLEKYGNLDRELEYLPNNEVLKERKAAREGLSRPEIAVLLAYSKQLLKKDLLLDADLLDEEFVRQELMLYFPEQLQTRYPDEIQMHRLSREIVTNQLVNNLVNRLGIIFPYRLLDETACSIAAVVNAYKLVCRVFAIDALWRIVENIDNHFAVELQSEIKLTIRKTIERAMNWFMHNELCDCSAMQIMRLYTDGINDLSPVISNLLPEHEQQQINAEVDRLMKAGAPAGLALQVTIMDILLMCLDVIEIHKLHAFSLQDVARIYFQLLDVLELSWLRKQIRSLPKETIWESRSRSVMWGVFKTVSCLLTVAVLQTEAGSLEKKFQLWLQANEKAIARHKKLMATMQTEKAIDLEKITVALQELRSIQRDRI